MPLTVNDVIRPTLAREIEQEVLDLCATGGLPVTSWQSGGVVRTIIWAISQVVADKVKLSVEIAKGGLGDFASGDWTKLWAQQIFDVLFVPAQAASGYVKFVNSSATSHGPFAAGQITVAHSATGKTYRTQSVVSIPGNSTTAEIAISADEVGTASNAAPGMVSRMVTTLSGVTVSNPKAVLGADEETPEALVNRSRSRWGTLSPLGPKKAYDYVARTPLDSFDPVDGNYLTPTSTPITRSKTVGEKDSGDVTVYVATASGAPIQADVDLVTIALQRWAEPWCVDAIAVAATEKVIAISYTVWIRSSLSTAQIEAQIAIALSIYFAAVDVGGVNISPNPGAIYEEALTNVIHNAVPGIELVELTSPVGDTPIGDTEVVVLGTVSPITVKL